ncbi:Aste57867_23585 [Aphanomyces stellatus]|uniref:Aste57867_23585 protein n=1 Tax=Aphanomyces stellatus TaxID=120398 RepID=A0A485LN77_9STRA|nr:hypothetical protein As57867_023514 [Aphanomyces stellatus]VFU00230.1 Aste57867_23585 [Aphanomyces stellatus]
MFAGTFPSLAPDEIAAHAPLTARHVVLSLISYFLFFTDIPRSGYGFKTVPYPVVSTNQYSLYGPYNYPVTKIERNSTTGPYVALDSKGGSVPGVDLWLYKFDTTSVGMRAMMHHFAPDAWDPCLAYKTTCASPLLDIETVFNMLDGLITILAARDSPMLLRVESYFLDKIYDVFAPFAYREKYRQSIQGHVFNHPANKSVCQPVMENTRPLFCQLSWSNYTRLGASPAAAMQVADFIQAKAQSYSLRPNQTLQLLLLENTVDNTPDTGGVIDTGIRNFDIVTLFRVQTCDGPCVTTTIEDYRFEGGILTTNTLSWYRTLRLLRFIGQLYHVLRVFALLIGCYLLLRDGSTFSSASVTTKLVEVLKLGLRVPCQVVVYGSWFPIALFVVAHTIDSTMLYQFSASEWTSILGAISYSPVEMMTIVTCHMRNVWLLCLVSKLHLLSYPIPSLALHGVPGVRGYAFISASFFSIFLGIRLKSLRSTELLHVVVVPPSPHLGTLKTVTSPPFVVSNGGLWLDLKLLLVAGFVVLVLLRMKFHNVLHVPTFIPHGALVCGSPLPFSTSWFGSLLDPAKVNAKERVGVVLSLSRSRNIVSVLMNLTWMTDPVLYIYVLWEAPMVYVYEHKATKATFLHPLPPKLMAAWKHEDADSFQLIGKHHLMGLPWPDRLYLE